MWEGKKKPRWEWRLDWLFSLDCFYAKTPESGYQHSETKHLETKQHAPRTNHHIRLPKLEIFWHEGTHWKSRTQLMAEEGWRFHLAMMEGWQKATVGSKSPWEKWKVQMTDWTWGPKVPPQTDLAYCPYLEKFRSQYKYTSPRLWNPPLSLKQMAGSICICFSF